jgi:hypothetical protein
MSVQSASEWEAEAGGKVLSRELDHPERGKRLAGRDCARVKTAPGTSGIRCPRIGRLLQLWESIRDARAMVPNCPRNV